MKRPLLFAYIAACLIPYTGFAGQDRDRGRAPYQVDVDLEFEIQVPNIIFFQIGSGNDTIDTVTFDLTGVLPDREAEDWEEDSSGFIDETVISAADNGSIPIRLRGNVGQVSITATVSGGGNGMVNENGHFLAFDLIRTVTSDNAFPAPALTNQGGTTVVIYGNLHGGMVTDRSINWTYQYVNPDLPAGGTYVGTVTYTASIF